MFRVNKICENGEPLSLKTDGRLRVVFIGVGSAFAKRRRQSNILLIQGDHHVLMDCGTQGPLALNDIGLDVRQVNCYLPTHSHADHIGGFEEVMLMNRYAEKPTQPKLIILRDYQDLLWSKSLSGGAEFCESQQGRSLQLSDFFDILRPTTVEDYGRKCWEIKYGPLELLIMRTRHFPDSATSVDESQWCSGLLVNKRVWISGDTMFDYEYPERFHREAEVMFHDCQLFQGGVHASYQELMTLPKEIRGKIFLYHFGDNWDHPETWVKNTDKFTGDPLQDGFLGWTEQQVAYDFE
ncbi:MAG: MBL fold metallo-hydrolase [Nitrospinaceae bacterium]|nr:MBL fold metallo-hydrolase [Nitrospinaceae bacterium]NIR55868.1 MBL fold metallo-hydrolase [Nitrospinaceae bacterium]NIS86321.1 MBL fold metallo-hydrolase [Nitrospinaceae bacterium]NIT83151.1 MBL fold metallo-hydrolase [Nitrospinaceae bacterium]NIU45360.1 MBL fold metallo-hydrolase [Nitrospinaceae bacterium]